ncbi:MAG: serine--tRNA ligase [Patescibacteria group bacterium]|nr:serine--tRNA ligase [Patescibacteria group bacterium]
MIDINFIRENAKEVKRNCERRNCPVDIDEILQLDEQRRKLITSVDEKRAEVNGLSKVKPSLKELKKLKQLKKETKDLESSLSEITATFNEKMSWIPNMLSKDVPDGKDDSGNKEVARWGDKPQFSFKVLDHQELGEKLDILDKERGAKVSQSRFYFWKGDGAILSWALFSWAQKFLTGRGFTFFITPDLAKEKTLFGTGYLPYFPQDIYKVEGTDLSLIGTSEQVLVGSRMDEILQEKDLPLKYLGFSPSFRTEAGSYGKDTRGVFRVHQFYKLEQIIFCKPNEGEKWHLECQKNEEDMVEALKLPYRSVITCVGDTAAPGYKKYDLEAWFPGQNKYRELTSNTNLTDFQTRRLNIRCKSGGNKYFPYTISATGVTERWVLAILENYQQEDGSVLIPEVLKPFVGKDKIEKISKS